ncbi:unnamed protein product, partial [Closterium sp. NIES-54]
GFVDVFSIGLSTIIIYAGVVPFYAQTYINGGPVALVWYWWLTALFTHCVALTFAEVSSSFPISGSLYFWAAALAGPKHGPFAAWITGWLEFFGISVGLGGVAFGGVQLLQYTIYAATGGANNGGYFLSNYECFGITAGMLIMGGLLTSLPIKVIGRINVFTAVWQIVLTLVIIVLLPCVAVTTQPASFVFTHYHVQLNQSQLPNAAYAFVVALQLSLYGQYSYDTVAHMAEETKHADRMIPLAMVSSLSCVCVLGWGLLVSLTFCIQSDDRLLGTDNETGGAYPVVQIIWDVFFSRFPTFLLPTSNFLTPPPVSPPPQILCVAFPTFPVFTSPSPNLPMSPPPEPPTSRYQLRQRHRGSHHPLLHVPRVLPRGCRRPHRRIPSVLLVNAVLLVKVRCPTQEHCYALTHLLLITTLLPCILGLSSPFHPHLPATLPAFFSRVTQASPLPLSGAGSTLTARPSTLSGSAAPSPSSFLFHFSLPLPLPAPHPPSPHRQAYSLSRDSGLPFASLWRRVNHSRTPIYAVWLCCSIAILFSLPLLDDSSTFHFITSLATVAWVGSYAVPIFFRLIQSDEDFEPGAFSLAPYVGHTGR